MFNFVESAEDTIAKHMRTRPLAVFSVLAFVFTVMRLYKTSVASVMIAFAVCFVFISLRLKGKINGFIAVFISLSTFFGIGVSSYHVTKNRRLIDELDGESALIYAKVSSVPIFAENSVSFYVDTKKICCHEETVTSKTKIYTTLYGDYSIKFGDRVKFNALCSKSYSYKKQSNYSFVSKGAPLKAKVEVLLDKKDAAFPRSIVSNLRNYILDVGDRFFDGETAMMFKALTAGDKSSYSKKLADKMSVAGISHIAAVSGLHVSILSLTLYNLLCKKNRIIATVLSLGLAVLFALVTGASPSTLRATLMFASYIFSKMSVRENDSVTSLCFSAMILTALNPYVIYDWGFILSFLSVLGILIFYAPINKSLKFLPKFLAESIAMTLSAQIMTLPALTNMFGKISVYSVVANIIVSVFFMATLCMCIVLVPISAFGYVNSFVAMITGVLIDAVVNVAGLFSVLPFNVIYVDAFNVYEHIVYYIAVGIFLFRKQIWEYLLSAVMMICIAVLIFGAYFDNVRIRETVLANDSLLMQKDRTVLLARDNLFDVYSDLKENYSADEINYLVVSEDVKLDSTVLSDIKNISETVLLYVPENMSEEAGVIMAKRNGYEIKTYSSSDENLHDFAANLAKKKTN